MHRALNTWLWLSLALLAGPLAAADTPVYSADLMIMADQGDDQALAKLQELAEGGHAQAQYDIGRHYLTNVKQDDDFLRVASWMQKAAEQGVSKAQLDLAVTLNMPGKAWDDPAQALKWFNVGMAMILKENPEGSQDQYAVFAANNAFRVSKRLWKAQVLEAEGLCRAWLEAHGVSAEEERRNLDAFLTRSKARNQ